MRITIYASVFVRPSETFIYDSAVELAASGADVEIIAARRELPNDCPFSPVHIAHFPKRWNLRRLALRILRPILGRPTGGEATSLQRRAIRRILQRTRPDVLIASYGQSGYLLAPLARELNIPLFVSFHGADASKLAREPVWQERYREMFKTVAVATGPSDHVRKKLIALGCPEFRAHVLHNGIRTDRFKFVPPSRRFDGGEIRFLFVGRLTDKKDPVSLLESFRQASDALLPQKSSLTLVGDGHLRIKVNETVEKLDLSDRVRLLGVQSQSEVIQHFAESHIFVQHSVTAPNGDEEGLPVAITEAMATGLPVISTRHSGIPEAIHENVCGLLVDEKDTQGMAECMVKLARDPALCEQFATAGRQRLEEEFATEVVQKRLAELLLIAINSTH